MTDVARRQAVERDAGDIGQKLGLAVDLGILRRGFHHRGEHFAFVVVGTLGYTWQAALGAVFVSGCLFLAVSLTGLREWVVNAIPKSLKFGISAGIGLFLGLIGLKNAGLVVASPATFVTLGELHSRRRCWRWAGCC